MIMTNIMFFPGEECCDTLHRTGQLQGKPRFNVQYPMLETQLKLEYVENLHLTTVVSGEGAVVRWSFFVNLESESLKFGSENTTVDFKLLSDIPIYTDIYVHSVCAPARAPKIRPYLRE